MLSDSKSVKDHDAEAGNTQSGKIN